MPQRAPSDIIRHYCCMLWRPNKALNLYTLFCSISMDFQYVTEDISYKVFTKGMRARWDSHISKNDELQLRADAIFSGLQTLFKERPGYMAVLCDSIVKKMDAILRNESTNLINPERNYWDAILVEWYQRNGRGKQSTLQLQLTESMPNMQWSILLLAS